MQPAMTAAATMAGLARWVRLQGSCRPSKLRLDVEIDRLPGGTMSPPAATHMEHPTSRHWNPASRKILSNPAASAAVFTWAAPGTTSAFTLGATVRPRAMAAAVG
jgi:hypothetical protein